MLHKYLQHAVSAAAVVSLANAKPSKIVPQDLQVGFAESGVDVQVSFTNNAADGFSDGTTFAKNDVTKAPTFAYGDSSGIVGSALYTIILLDTTCDNARTLHFAQANFKYDFDITNLVSGDKALLDYKAPGAFKETGDDRKYSFLMYDNPQEQGQAQANITSLKLPDEGKTFDVKKFQDDNGFIDPVAGVGMVVKLGGTSNCGGNQNNGGASGSSAAASASAPASSSSAAASSNAPAKTSAAVSRGSTAAASRVPTSPASAQDSSTPTSGAGDAPSATNGDSAQTTDIIVASSAAQGPPASTVQVTSVAPGATGSLTGSGTPAIQTGSDASTVSITTARCVVLAAAIGFGILLMG
ncbi:hypothetical protein BCR34DRAFT_472896 [Clohesyomyces aquaticus]|uniref:Phosphatidylethanolamine-binding protein n=1 Tax=Clohesyomyces aquaticus TaxID=1231657 RepID=A0A1Y2A8I9_9PLEO|nr:hypothetical protein BCR34DRAFT_472896 [Clohesyomyces aquaticus]